MTYSIVARDPNSGTLGVGVQTHQPCVGAIVPWVKAGVGAVATQSYANINFGPQGLALMASGLPASRALAAIVAGDDMPRRRQVALVDDEGGVAVHTGDDCIPFASHVIGKSFSTQANMMTNAGVPEAMAAAFTSAPGHLALRIMAALNAAQAAGGDIRGSQSAALVTLEPGSSLNGWDLRVDNSKQPLSDLQQLVNIRTANGVLSLVREETSLAEAMRMFEEASALYPSDEQTFWFAVNSLTAIGEADRAVELLGPLFAKAPQWRELLARLSSPGAAALKPRFGP